MLEKLGIKNEYLPLAKDWMVQGVIPNHKAILALGNELLVNTDEPSQVDDEKDSEDLSLYSSNIPFHKWKALADFD